MPKYFSGFQTKNRGLIVRKINSLTEWCTEYTLLLTSCSISADYGTIYVNYLSPARRTAILKQWYFSTYHAYSHVRSTDGAPDSSISNMHFAHLVEYFELLFVRLKNTDYICIYRKCQQEYCDLFHWRMLLKLFFQEAYGGGRRPGKVVLVRNFIDNWWMLGCILNWDICL